jgi:hypothetical protein
MMEDSRIEIVITIDELRKIKVRFFADIEYFWEKYMLTKLADAGAPIRKRFLRPPVIERGRVYRMDLPEDNAIKLVWEDD